jgi:formylmethanofuran dehydrogenase subunit A
MGVDARDPWVAYSFKGYGVKIVRQDSVGKWGERFCVHLIKQRRELFGVDPEGLMDPGVV